MFLKSIIGISVWNNESIYSYHEIYQEKWMGKFFKIKYMYYNFVLNRIP